MSIASEITRLQNIKSDIQSALVSKGITGAASHDMADFAVDISNIQDSGAILTVTYSEEFYGATLTASNGSETVTKVAPSTGSVDIDVPEGGSWVISAAVGGETYSSKPVVVELEYATVIEAIPDGSTVTPTDDIQTWLKCAGIRDKDYTTLAEVLADTDTFIALCADSNACDYMARSTTWALAEGLVPVMTSATAPSGTVISLNPQQAYPPFQAFDRNASTYGTVLNTVGNYIGYEFDTPQTIGALFADCNGAGGGKWKVQYKINGSWEDGENLDIPSNGSIHTSLTQTTQVEGVRLVITEKFSTYTGNGFNRLQFYTDADITTNSTAMLIVGKYNYCAKALLGNATWASAIGNSSYWASVLRPLVPNLTSNTSAQSNVGVAMGTSTYSTTGYDYWQAFSQGITNTQNNGRYGWSPKTGTTPYICAMHFNTPRKAAQIRVARKSGTATSVIKAVGSTNGTNWVDISNNVTINSDTTSVTTDWTYPYTGIINITSDDEYEYIGIQVVSSSIAVDSGSGYRFEIYGRTDNANYIPLVPRMTSNTTPSGECISISEYSSSNKAYFAFDGDAESTWTSASTTVPVWLGYHSPQPIIVSGVKVRFGNNIATNVSTTFKLQYSDTGNNDDWTDIGNAITTTATTEQFYTFENSTAHPYHHIYITAQTLNNANYKGAISTLQFYCKPSSTDVVIHSAVEDNIFYMDDGSPVALCGIPVGDTVDVDLEAYKGQTLTLVSTVAKDPTNLSNDFTMPIRITPNITEIYLMPVGALYWWGSVNSDLENGTSANGWNQGGYTFSNPTYNKNEITLSSSLNHVSAIGSKTQISGTCKAIMQGVTADSGIYGYITPTASKATIDTSGITYIQSNTVSLYTKTTSSQYIYIGCANARSTKVKALWLE